MAANGLTYVLILTVCGLSLLSALVFIWNWRQKKRIEYCDNEYTTEKILSDINRETALLRAIDDLDARERATILRAKKTLEYSRKQRLKKGR